MKTIISSLVERMLDDSYHPSELQLEGIYESDKTVSWKAYEEARSISNLGLFEELYLLVENPKPDVKRCAYFILGYNARNTNDLSSKSYLLRRLEKEQDMKLLILILQRLADIYKPSELNLEPIRKLTNSRNARVRRFAFEALTNSEQSAEPFLLERLRATKNNDDVNALISALMYVGTKIAIPYIEPYLKHRKPEIKGHSHNVLTVIMLREGFSFDEIHVQLKVSHSFINTHVERLSNLTRLGY